MSHAVRTIFVAVAGLLAAIGATTVAPAARGQVLPPTLEGETFTSNQVVVPGGHSGGGTIISERSTCDPTGTSTVSFTTDGVAAGPYPGTFTETVTVAIGPQTGPPVSYPDLASSATFATGQVVTAEAGVDDSTVILPAASADVRAGSGEVSGGGARRR